MLGLGGYASSDEEDEDSQNVPDKPLTSKTADQAPTVEKSILPPPHSAPPHSAPPPSAVDVQNEAPVLGPAPGPAMPPDNAAEFNYEDEPAQELTYEDERIAIRNMTMPPIPSFEIPPSPPGSPPPGSTKKFAHFLKLKKQGVHFNERLQKTPALKNPTLFQKLTQHAGINAEEQYATTLSNELATPTRFPPWAYADELNKSQAKIRQKKEQKPREAIEFVSAGGSSASSQSVTPRTGEKSAAGKASRGSK